VIKRCVPPARLLRTWIHCQ